MRSRKEFKDRRRVWPRRLEMQRFSARSKKPMPRAIKRISSRVFRDLESQPESATTFNDEANNRADEETRAQGMGKGRRNVGEGFESDECGPVADNPSSGRFISRSRQKTVYPLHCRCYFCCRSPLRYVPHIITLQLRSSERSEGPTEPDPDRPTTAGPDWTGPSDQAPTQPWWLPLIASLPEALVSTRCPNDCFWTRRRAYTEIASFRTPSLRRNRDHTIWYTTK